MLGGAARAALASRSGRTALALAEGLLEAPRYGRAPPWLSGTAEAVCTGGAPGPGWIEHALASGPSAALAAEARPLAARVVAEGLGGAAWAPCPDPALLRPGRVLVRVGSIPDDKRLAAALARGPAGDVVLLADRIGPALAERAEELGCAVVAAPADPWALLDGAAALHADGDDRLALLAQLAGVRLFCHAPGLFAGWGTSTDSADVPRRPQTRTRDEVAAAALLLGARYADPFSGRAIGCGAALDVASEWRRATVANRAVGSCTGMAFWKRRRMGRFLHSGLRAPPHRRTAAAAVRAAGGRGVAVWSSRMPNGLAEAAAAAGLDVLRVEDGFIRSRGLGSDFLPPCSIVVDGSGVYYDPSGPSDLETLLRETDFGPALLERAARLTARLVGEGVTKYGAGTSAPALEAPPGARRILAPGQVADDLSVRLGGAGVAGNADLLERVRARNPDAWIVYRPHPDVDAGHRPGAIPDGQALRSADAVLRGGSMAALIGAVDEVHTLTSLAGYEALLRGRRVVVHGQPFYAGWGLTEDLAPMPARRGRRLTLDELSAGMLLLYARYVDPVTGLPCAPEVLLDRLATPELWRPGALMRLRQAQGRTAAAFRRLTSPPVLPRATAAGSPPPLRTASGGGGRVEEGAGGAPPASHEEPLPGPLSRSRWRGGISKGDRRALLPGSPRP